MQGRTICGISFPFWTRRLFHTCPIDKQTQVYLLRIALAMSPATTSDVPDGRTRKGRFVDAATFGAFLENHRAGRNLSLHDVAAETKIATRHLAALERGDVRAWPGGLYRRAMVRAYASAIGLDPNVTVCEFADAFNEGPAEVEPDRNLESLVVHGLLSVRPRASVCVGLAVCAAIAALTWATTSSDAAGAMGMNRIRPGSTAGDRADAPSAPTTSGPASPSGAANVETHPPVATVMPLQSPPSQEPPADVEGAMRIISEPAGAQVTVNGIRWGQTPVTVRHLAPGEKRVRISKDGFTSAERWLQVTPDHSTQTVRVVLAVGP
jgi:helix-turn-helix protein/PEGA domain-containing protein